MTNTTTLTHQSIAIVKQNKLLLIFPSIATILTIATFVIGFIPLFQIEAAAWANQGHVSGKTFTIFMVILLSMFLLVGLITLLFNAALTACILKHVQQEPYTLLFGLKTMFRLFIKIFMIKVFYDAIAVYVKCMRYWVDNWNASPQSINLVSGLPWNDAVILLTPVLVAENTSFLQTLKRSAFLVKNKWGSDVTLRANIFSRMMSAVGLIALAPIIIGVIIGGTKAITIGASITASLMILKTIIQSTTQVITSCALYLYAIDMDVARYFDLELLKKAFRLLTKKELHVE